MKSLKVSLVVSFIKNPIRFRFGMLVAGVISAFLHPLFGSPVTTTFTEMKIALLLTFSTMVYTFLLTLYRLVQLLFNRKLPLPDQDKHYDERILVRAAGLFWFIPFGGTLHTLAYFAYIENANFGTILIVQGLSLTLGAWLSQIIKK